MSEEMIVRNCAPTLAGMKTASLFACTYTDLEEVRSMIRSCNHQLRKKGLRFLPLQIEKNRVLIYVYRPACLLRDLRHETACRLLQERGYCMQSPEHCVVQLAARMKAGEEFPHEIGLFLGYPPEDVCGFIEHRSKECKCVGCWKVYGDVRAAQKTFAKYKKCADVYALKFSEGYSMHRLTVSG